MRKLFLPITVLGLGGLGMLFLSDRGRRILQWLVESLEDAPSRLLEWNQSAQEQLDSIQSALDQVAESLQSFPPTPQEN